ncbi:hypothetical protein D623_10032738 [Myotis brandtii]|uniref:Uncharacterized protein n=1 Tax=Myotis brandtii TaxID=109478 RepID=S7N4Q0_MYOBR|nr:hypothetical protein D623_10032738 [Myotis brandtii]
MVGDQWWRWGAEGVREGGDGEVGNCTVVAHEVPSFMPLHGPSHRGLQSLVCWKPCSHRCHSHTLTVLALLTPVDGAEQAGPVPSAVFIAPQKQGEVENPSGRSGPALGTGSGCEQWLQHRQLV